MKKRIPVAFALLVLCLQPAVTQTPAGLVRISVMPTFDIPLGFDANLFQPSAGLAVNGSYIFPHLRFLSAGFTGAYHLGRMSIVGPGDLGSLSVISGETKAAARVTVGRLIELTVSGGAGFFYAFSNKEPSSTVSNLVWGGGVGIGVRVSPGVTVNLHGEYRSFETLYQYAGIGLSAEISIGG